MALVRTACPLNCYDTCTMLLTVRDGRVVEVRGDPDHPVTAGFVCPKASAQLERHYSSSRILHPMLRTTGGWRRISWREALDMLAGHLERARRAGPHTILHYHDHGSSGLLKSLSRRFFNALGGVTEATGSLCWAAGVAAQRYDFGHHLAHDPSDLVHSRLIILWGRNPVHTNIHLVPFLRRARHARVVLIDPGYSASAALAHQHLKPRPGTDGALALALAAEIIRHDRADLDFLTSCCLGYDRFQEAALSWTPERAGTVTGVDPESIASLARGYAGGPSAIILGYGMQRYSNSGQTVRAIDGLGAVAGQLGRPGGGVNYANGWAELTLTSLTGRELRKHRQEGIPRAALADGLLGAAGRDMRMLVVTGANPVNQLPDASRTRRALATIPFKVVMDLRWSETAQEADLVLPAASWLEQEDLFASSWHKYLTYAEQVVAPRGEARSEPQVFSELACMLDLPGDWQRQAGDWIQLALEPLGLDAAGLRGSWFANPAAQDVPWSDRLFMTPSGRFEFVSGLAVSEGAPAAAAYREPAEAGLGSTWAPTYPFFFLSPRHRNHTHSQFYSNMLSVDGFPSVFLHPSALARLRINPGEVVIVSSPRGSLQGRAQARAGQREDVVVVYEGGSVLTGAGANLLTPQGLTDLGLGARFYDCRCRVDRAVEEVAAG